MKKIILIISVIVTLLISCQKNEVPEKNKSCNCGTIANDGIDINSNGSSCYWLEIRSDCSGNKKKFCFDEDIWLKSQVGSHFCVSNQTGW